jgi:serine/threonine-protein kinase RsbT
VRATFVDLGPGIADLQSAMAGGNSTRGGLGMGLSGSRRLVDVFELETNPGRGTRVSVTKWKR